MINVTKTYLPNKEKYQQYVDEEDGKVIETARKFEFNLGFVKVSRSIKKVKK